jgi:hypothetical protein
MVPSGRRAILPRCDHCQRTARAFTTAIEQGNRIAATDPAGTPCSTALMLGLAEAIDRAGRGDSRAVIVMPPAEPGSATWRWEFADTLVDRC